MHRRAERGDRMSADRVTAAILADLLSARHPGVVVDSPPGAGKSTLVVRAAAEIAATGEPVMIVAQTNEQVDDLVVRLSARFGAERPDAVVGRLSRAGFGAPQRIEGLTNVAVSADAGELAHAAVIIATAAKWA